MNRLALAAVVAVFLSGGCGSPVDGKCRVSGNVTFGGSMITDGAIYFVARHSEAVLGFSKIVGGRYSAQVAPGRTRVRISADRLVPGRKNEAGNPLIEQYVPPRFNDATELEATIERNQQLDWDLPAGG
jgi:hypothetical protein